jgi:hypothetical protein
MRSTHSYPHLMPDVDNPNFYCQSCEKTYSSKTVYRQHSTITQRLILAPIVRDISNFTHPHIQPDENKPDFYCEACGWKLKRRDMYRKHLVRILKMTLTPIHKGIILFPHIKPDPGDINNYCGGCDKTLSSKNGYWGNVRNVPKMVVLSNKTGGIINNPEAIPDPEDPNFFLLPL